MIDYAHEKRSAEFTVSNNFTNYKGDIELLGGVREFGDCVDRCIYARLEAIEDGNVIDKIEFVAGVPWSFFYIVASCSVDCL
jgi:hypothetical protein